MNKQTKHIENKTFLADWMAGKITDKELQDFVSPEEFLTYKKMQYAFDLLEKPVFDTTASFTKLKAKLPKKQTITRKLIPNWAYAVAASFILFLGVFQYYNADISNQTLAGQTKEIALNEGTSIQLNALSAITYSKYQNQRDISLQGEAYFKVTKKGTFSVHTSNGIIEVLGTEFNVISRNGFLEVICYEGKVAVTSQGKRWTLLPNDAWKSYNGKTEIWKTSKLTASWLEGESSFKSTPLVFVLQAIENQYAVQLISENFDKSILFTGSFTHNSIDKALKSICLPLGLEYKKDENSTILLSKK